MNQILIYFVPCEPTPANGYNVRWRVFGSADAYTDAGNFTSSPAVFIDDTNPDGTNYEGFIRSDCTESGESGNNYGSDIPWNAIQGGESGGEVQCRQITMNATVGTPNAHYRGCDGVIRDTLITSGTVICTDGHGFTISGGGIIVVSEVEGDC